MRLASSFVFPEYVLYTNLISLPLLFFFNLFSFALHVFAVCLIVVSNAGFLDLRSYISLHVETERYAGS